MGQSGGLEAGFWIYFYLESTIFPNVQGKSHDWSACIAV